MPDPFSLKNSSCTISPLGGKIRGFITFPREVNVIARLEYELAYYDSAVYHFFQAQTYTFSISCNVYLIKLEGCPRGVMVKAIDSGIVVSEFVLQSRYYVHFRTNTLGKGMNPLILRAMG